MDDLLINLVPVARRRNMIHRIRGLLLEADPAPGDPDERVLIAELVLTLERADSVAGVLVAARTDLDPNASARFEITHLAVAAEHRRKGFATRLIEATLEFARLRDIRAVEIATGSTSFAQLRLYQSLGFRVVGVRRDVFVPPAYPEPIYENGLRCRDQIVLCRDPDTALDS